MTKQSVLMAQLGKAQLKKTVKNVRETIRNETKAISDIIENIGWDVVEGVEIPERLPANNDSYFMIAPETTANDAQSYLDLLVSKIESKREVLEQKARKRKYVQNRFKDDIHELQPNEFNLRKLSTLFNELHQNEQKHKFLDMVSRLQVPIENRTNREDYKILKRIVEGCHFLDKIKQDMHLNDQDVMDFCKHLTYEKVEAGDVIYNRDDEINKIYYILKGKVAATYPFQTIKELKELDEAKKEDEKVKEPKIVQFGAGSGNLVINDYKSQRSNRSRGSFRSRNSKRSSRSRTSRRRDGNTLLSKGFPKQDPARAQCEELKEMLDILMVKEQTDRRNSKTKEHIANSITRSNCIDRIEDEYDTRMKNDEYRQKKWPNEEVQFLGPVAPIINLKAQIENRSNKKQAKQFRSSRTKSKIGELSDKKHPSKHHSQANVSRQFLKGHNTDSPNVESEMKLNCNSQAASPNESQANPKISRVQSQKQIRPLNDQSVSHSSNKSSSNGQLVPTIMVQRTRQADEQMQMRNTFSNQKFSGNLRALQNKLSQNLKIEKLDNSQLSESFFDKAPIKRMNTTQNKKKSAQSVYEQSSRQRMSCAARKSSKSTQGLSSSSNSIEKIMDNLPTRGSLPKVLGKISNRLASKESKNSMIQVQQFANTPSKKSQSRKTIRLDKIYSKSQQSSEAQLPEIDFNRPLSNSDNDSHDLSEEEQKRNSIHDSDSINRSSDFTLEEEDLSLINSDTGEQEEELLNILQEGQYFGTANMVEQTVKAPVTTYAAKTCHLLVINSKAMHDLRFNYEDRIKQEHFRFMQEIYLFQKLSRGRVHKLKDELETEIKLRGQYLFTERQPATHVYIVKKGVFKITKEIAVKQQTFEDENTDDLQQLLKAKTNNKRKKMASRTDAKKEVIDIGFVGRGTVIGEEDTLRGGFHQTSCVCFKQSDFKDTEDNGPAIVMKISKERLNKLLRGQITDKEIEQKIQEKGSKLEYGCILRNKVKLHMRRLSKKKSMEDQELQSTQETEPVKRENSIPKAFDLVSDEQKVTVEDPLQNTVKSDDENKVSKKSLLASVRGEIVKLKDVKKASMINTDTAKTTQILTERQNFGNDSEQAPRGQRTRIAQITESIDKDLAFSHTNVDRKQVFATNDGKALISKKANLNKHKSVASSFAKPKIDNKASFAVMNSYSTASLPQATVTQTWNIQEAMKNSARQKEGKMTTPGSLPQIAAKATPPLQIPVPSGFKKSHSNRPQDTKPGLATLNRILPMPLTSKNTPNGNRSRAANLNIKNFRTQLAQNQHYKRGEKLRSEVLTHEMLNSNQTSAAQIKRLKKMKELAEFYKTTDLQLKKLKEATNDIRDGIYGVEWQTRRKNSDKIRAGYLIQQDKGRVSQSHQQLTALSQKMSKTYSVPKEVMGKPQNRQGQSHLYNSHALIRNNTKKVSYQTSQLA